MVAVYSRGGVLRTICYGP